MKAVPDPRCGRTSKHDHAEVLVCLVTGFLAGRLTIRRSLKWCRKHLEWLRQYLPLKNGVASPSTACRILAGIDEELFALQFTAWIGEIVETRGIHLIIDGKALRAAMEKVKNFRAPMVMNAIDAATGLVLAQLPLQNKECEITVIPELLKVLDIRESTVTIDAIGTQTEIMGQIIRQGGHFVLTVKRNQPQSYEEICLKEKNRDRYEIRRYRVCRYPALLTKTQEEWPFIRTAGEAEQIRIPIERDENGNDITPDEETFRKQGSRRKPKPKKGDGEDSDIQITGIISDRELTAEEMGGYKRAHWAVENKLHHVLDDTFREDRSPAKKSKNNLALLRKFSYNLLRIAMIREKRSDLMTEMMDEFCDDHALIEKYVFRGVKSFY
ncbi:MAG TPA: ISAs1 family transposase [Candidatus Blautia ornithocaccae]|nr:ISAs1 family transposase [Candidatus Blautia ornithocaccae]